MRRQLRTSSLFVLALAILGSSVCSGRVQRAAAGDTLIAFAALLNGTQPLRAAAGG